MPVVLLYHDVVDRGDDPSGFPGAVAERYKLTPAQFKQHLDALAASGARPSLTLPEPGEGGDTVAPLVLTFDDGGTSMHTHVADELESRGWRGVFFITTGRIGTPGFLDRWQIADLRERGHVVGSHSYSHPTRISSCAQDELAQEWGRSCDDLAAILGEEVTTGSVPGGYYSRAVARAAARAGLRSLFTSEPTTRVHEVDGCTILGRYTIHRGTPTATAVAIASGRVAPRLGQAWSWRAKKLAKVVAGEKFIAASNLIFRKLS
jgi:peptidoglycan/xylan/chitin deacetylase (PgdA/CDA1 family)